MDQQSAAHDINVLNGLIETTLDSVDGYHRAAHECPNRRFRTAFMDRVVERELVIRRLRERVAALGGRPEDEGSILAKVHRAFLALRDRIDSDGIVAEVDHGESYLAGKWELALEDAHLSAETRELISACHESIRRGHEEWRRAHVETSGTASGASAVYEAAGEAAGAAQAGI